MSKSEKKEGGLFSKKGDLFESKEDKVLEADNNFFSGLKSKFFGDNTTEDIIDIEAFEIVAEDMWFIEVNEELSSLLKSVTFK